MNIQWSIVEEACRLEDYLLSDMTHIRKIKESGPRKNKTIMSMELWMLEGEQGAGQHRITVKINRKVMNVKLGSMSKEEMLHFSPLSRHKRCMS